MMAAFALSLCTAGGEEEKGKMGLGRARHAGDREAGLLIKLKSGKFSSSLWRLKNRTLLFSY